MNRIEEAIKELMDELTSHKIYKNLRTLEDVKVFSEYHVFAVWDFMSLLKELQNQLTCTTSPWTPVKNNNTARFINEIVLGEETDVDSDGKFKSHFEMYLDSMKEVGANTEMIEVFVEKLVAGETVQEALDQTNVPQAVHDFVSYTFSVIETGESHKIASAFTFGREGLIPDIFIEILNKSEALNNESYESMIYYLQRHIELDGDEHGPMSMKMMDELCEDEKMWEEAIEVAKESIRARIKLWDGISEALMIGVA